MRVISGVAKGRRLKMVPGRGTRPIMDRVKENLFNLIQWDVRGSRFLDLFAGTGAVGIEALSRGALEAVLLDTDRLAVAVIRENLEHCRLADRARVLRTDAFTYLSNEPDVAYDFVYIAPPQYRGLWSRALALIDSRPSWLASSGQAIVQIHPKEHLALELGHLELVDQRRYGSTLLCFYQRASQAEEGA